MLEAGRFCRTDFQVLADSASVLDLSLVVGMPQEDTLWIADRIYVAAQDIDGQFPLERPGRQERVWLGEIPRLQFLTDDSNQCPGPSA